MILGAVLAGGRSLRFGRDKALAELGGQTLLARAVAALGATCDCIVVVGRDSAPAPVLADWPASGMGPLGGVAAALRHAAATGHDAVLTVGVDSLDLPPDLAQALAPPPAYLADQPVVGLWPATALTTVMQILTHEGRHSMLQFAHALNARAVTAARRSANINTAADLAAAEARHAL